MQRDIPDIFLQTEISFRILTFNFSLLTLSIPLSIWVGEMVVLDPFGEHTNKYVSLSPLVSIQ